MDRVTIMSDLILANYTVVLANYIVFTSQLIHKYE